MKKLGTLLFVITIVFLSGCIQNTNNPEKINVNLQEGEKIIIGEYFDMPTSMCSQNCQNYYLGNVQLTEAITGLDENTNFGNYSLSPIFAIGKIIQIEELPTLAGPEQTDINPNKKVKVNKFKIRKYYPINFLKISISHDELEKYSNGKDSIFELKFSNPTNLYLDLKILLGNEKTNQYENIILNAHTHFNIKYIYKGNNEKHSSQDSLSISIKDNNSGDNIALDYDKYINFSKILN